jgi:23S rRNA pseudouridine1911/1915/1917 synthase
MHRGDTSTQAPIAPAANGGLAGTIGTNGRLDKEVSEASGLSRARVQALIADGRVTLAGAIARQPSAKVTAGTPFAIDLPETVALAAVAQDIPLVIAYEDEHLVVVDKPAGLVVHPAAGNLDGTLVNALLHHCAGQLSGIGGVARPGIVHRIDKDTSGLLVVAKSDIAHEGLARQFADHSIERAYRAIVGGQPVPGEGTLRGVIARSSSDRKKMALLPDGECGGPLVPAFSPASSPGPAPSHARESGRGANRMGRGKHAVTHYRVMERFGTAIDPGAAALVECRLETGRTHQVRVHLASIGHPLLGDPVYGRTPRGLRPLLAELGFSRQALHAAVLGFIHPVSGETLRFSSEIPEDMRELLARLGDFNRAGVA